jgi:ATP-binding cassette, subfamily B, multidrug efflux pump
MSQAYHSHDEVDKQARNFKLLFRLLRYVQPYRGNIIAAIVLLLCASLLDSAVPMLTMRTIDAVINNPAIASPDSQSAGVAGNARHAELIRMVCIIGVLMLMDMIVRCFQVVIVVYVSQKAMMAMRLGVFTHLQGVSLRYLDKNPVGRLMTRVTDDVEKLQESIVAGMVEVFNDAFTFVVVLGFMFYVNWQLTLVTLIAVPFIALTSIVFGNYARRSYLDIRKRIARVNSHLQETISGIRVVQIFGREQRNFEAFSALNAEHRDAWTRQVRNYAIYFPVVDFLATSTTALIILYGGHQILNGYLTGSASRRSECFSPMCNGRSVCLAQFAPSRTGTIYFLKRWRRLSASLHCWTHSLTCRTRTTPDPALIFSEMSHFRTCFSRTTKRSGS